MPGSDIPYTVNVPLARAVDEDVLFVRKPTSPSHWLAASPALLLEGEENGVAVRRFLDFAEAGYKISTAIRTAASARVGGSMDR